MRFNLKIAIDFANKIQKIKGVTHIILFGSVALGEDTDESDIDIGIIHKRKKFELLREINKVKPEKVQVTLLTLNELPKEGELVSAFSGEGILLYGSPIIIKKDRLKLENKVIISYFLNKLKQSDKMKVNRALYGSVSKFRKNGKQYVTETKGFLNEPGIEKLNKGVLLVDRIKSNKIIGLLKRFNVEYKEIPVLK